jgi:hypothetical protein
MTLILLQGEATDIVRSTISRGTCIRGIQIGSVRQ